jgi:hypothetical protein
MTMTTENTGAGSLPRHRSAEKANARKPAEQSWRDVLKVHPAAELFPRMSDDELRALADDIKKHGLKVPVVLLKERGKLSLLDGISRLDAMQLAGKLSIKNGELYGCNSVVSESAEPYTLAASLNALRRHLTREQKHEIVAKLLKVMPVKSNRQIGELAKADDKTVGKIRGKLESTVEIPQLKTRVGKDNKSRPAAKRKKSLPHGWKRKPLPDCPMCEGTGWMAVSIYTACGVKMSKTPHREACHCVFDTPCPTIDQLKDWREEGRKFATEAERNLQFDPAPADPHREANDADLPDIIRNLISPALKAQIEALDPGDVGQRDQVVSALRDLVDDARALAMHIEEGTVGGDDADEDAA